MFGKLRRRVVFVPLLIVVLASISGGVVLAQEMGDGESPRERIFQRAAEILGLDESEVSDAFEQAHQELVDEKVDELLASLVEDGTLTEEESAEIRAWLDERPEAIKPVTAPQLRGLVEGATTTIPFLDGKRIERFRIQPHQRLPRLPEFRFGDGFGFELPDINGLTPEEFRQQLEEQLERFEGNGRFEFRFGDREPFHFEFPAPGDNEDDSDSQDTSI